MRFGLLGPLEVTDETGATVDVGGRQSRLALAVLVASAGRSLPVDGIIEAIWNGAPPASAAGTLQSYVSRLRRAVGATTIVWDDAGYRLDVDDEAVDHRRFEALAEHGRERLIQGDPDAARRALVEAERLWRGPALVEFADQDFATGLATRLNERRVAALEDRFACDLELGRAAAIVGEITEAVGEHPWRERLYELHALALYRSGRQADALRVLAAAGRLLRDELGIEPGRQLRDLEAAILGHDPALDLPASFAPPAGESAPGPAAGADPGDDAAADRPDRAGSPTTGPRTSVGGGSVGGGSVPLVGRAAERSELQAAWREATDDARFVVLEGEPGIGKTRLADELRVIAAADGAIAVWGRSDEGGAAPALWPWLPPLRALAASAESVPAPLTELLVGDAPVGAGQADAVQFERFEAVAELIDRVASAHPVAVLIDDLQWADTTSLELLAFLAGRVERNVAVVATVRRLEVGRNDAVTDALAAIAHRTGSRRLVLRGLREDETAEVLDATAGRALAPEVAATIHARAEGNPFYAIELARLADEEGGLGAEVPGSVGDVIRRRLRRLPEPTVDLLSVAAVVGRDVDLHLLTRAADQPLDGLLDALDPAVVHRLLVEVPERPGSLRFSHALVRQVLLDDLSALRRARLHLTVADAIEGRGAGVDDAEILAEHLWRAAPVGVGRRAAEALQAAAEIALRRVAYGAAEDLLSKAVQLRRASGSTPADDEAELMTILRLLEVARARRYFEGATGLDVVGRAKELAERTGHRDQLLDMMWFEYSALATSCRVTDANRLADAYYELTTDDPRPEVRAAGHEVSGVRHWSQGHIDEAVADFDQAIALLAEVPVPREGFAAEKWMVTHTFWLWTHRAQATMTSAETCARFDGLIDAQDDRFVVASICGFGATVALVLGDWANCERYAEIGRAADPGSQFSFWGGQTLMQLGVVRAGQGRIDDALVSFDEGKARYTGVGGRSALASFEASLALNLVAHGALDEARARIAAARLELETWGERWNESVVLLGEAVVAAAVGDPATARRLLERSVSVAHGQGAHAFAERTRRVAADLGVDLDPDPEPDPDEGGACA